MADDNYARTWFKFYGQDWLTDIKVMELSSVDRVAYVTLLCLASQSYNEKHAIKDCTEERLIRLMRLPRDEEGTAKGVLKRLNHMITLDENDAIIIPNFAKRQQRAMTSYERLKRYREKQKDIREIKGEKSNDNEKITDDNAMITNRRDKKRRDKKRDTETASVSNNEKDIYNDERFDFFWNEYPKKVGKGDAWGSWKKLKPSNDLARKIVISVREHVKKAEGWKKDGGRYIPNPSTFLNQRRFDDTVESGSRLSTGGKSDKFANLGKKI